jgi:type IV secretion system protein TrbG
MSKFFVVVVLFVSALRGQPPPVELKRSPPAGKPKPADGVPQPEKYPFDRLIQTIEGSEPSRLQGPRAVPMQAPSTHSELPIDFNPKPDVALPLAAQDALAVGQAWMTEKHAPAPGKDGRVLYTFGAGLPTIVCAPLRVCVVELEPGEHLVGEPHLGDAVRWLLAPASAGPSDSATPMIVLKPKQAGLDTNLLLTTDRRAYYFRLISKPEEYLARVAFAYPEEDARKWKAQMAADERRRAEALRAQVAPVDSIESLYFDYRIEGSRPYIRPVRVVDDGKKTFIQMSPESAHREVPVLVVLGPDGAEMVNYRVKGDMYIVDRLFERGALILGVGKKAQKVELIRGTYRGSIKVKADAYAVPALKEGGSR